MKKYLKKLLDENPSISSGRKNYLDFEKRLKKNILLTKKYISNKKIIKK
tara:strand:- start:650 stop:796 length:147 start_codon:yes stop_codon:yes gene_type:complete